MIMTNGLCLNWFIFKLQVKTLEENNEIINGVNIGNPCALSLITQFPHSFDCDLHFLRRSSPNSPLTAEKSSLSSHNQAQKINDAYYLERVINNLSNTTAWSVVKAQHTIFGQAGHSSCPIMIPVNFYHKMSIMKCLPIVWVIKRKKNLLCMALRGRQGWLLPPP